MSGLPEFDAGPSASGDEGAELLRRFVETGRNGFFSELFDRNWEAVFRCCRAIVQDDGVAEDVAQDAFIRAYQNARMFRGGSAVAWLCTIGRRLALNRLRSTRRESVGLELVPASGDPATFGDSVLSLVGAVLRTLSYQQRVALKMFYIEGFSYAEIAAKTEWPEGIVRSAIQNGRKQFEKRWNESAIRGDK